MCRRIFADNDYIHGFSEQGCNKSDTNPSPGTVNFTYPNVADPRCTTRSVNARHLAYYTDLKYTLIGLGPYRHVCVELPKNWALATDRTKHQCAEKVSNDLKI